MSLYRRVNALIVTIRISGVIGRDDDDLHVAPFGCRVIATS